MQTLTKRPALETFVNMTVTGAVYKREYFYTVPAYQQHLLQKGVIFII